MRRILCCSVTQVTVPEKLYDFREQHSEFEKSDDVPMTKVNCCLLRVQLFMTLFSGKEQIASASTETELFLQTQSWEATLCPLFET